MQLLTMRLVAAGAVSLATVCISALPAHCASSAPKELWGKSITVAWSETREQRPQGTQEWRFVSGTTKQTVYVSEKGRIFSQGVVATAGGTAVHGSSVDGKGGSAKAAGGSWQGRTYTGTIAMSKIARHFVVTFDPSFSSCDAQVTFGKEAGAIGLEYSPIIKQNNEVKGAKVTGASCSVQSGNAFAGR